MIIIFSKTNGEVFGRFERAATDQDGILKGYFGPTDEFWAGYHPSLEPEVYELTEAQNAAWDDEKLYSFDAVTKELTERERPKTPEEVANERVENIEAQVAYTAMMTDTLIEA